jgi:hypothetical protein
LGLKIKIDQPEKKGVWVAALVDEDNFVYMCSTAISKEGALGFLVSALKRKIDICTDGLKLAEPMLAEFQYDLEEEQ